MKLAILLMCHRLPQQIKMFEKAMKSDNITIFIHLDEKSDISPTEIENDNVVILPDKYRKDVQWAQISQVDAELALLRFARKSGKFDYYWLCSGQDYPIRSPEYILKALEQDTKANYLNLYDSQNHVHGRTNKYDKRNQLVFHKWMLSRNLGLRILKRAVIEITGGYNRTFPIFQKKNTTGMKFYFGSQWWCLNREIVDWILYYLKENRDYYRFFAYCSTPDESFFHTLVMNSPYAAYVKDYLHYIDWSEGNSSPKTLTMDDLERIEQSGKLMARKFDVGVDKAVMEKLPALL